MEDYKDVDEAEGRGVEALPVPASELLIVADLTAEVPQYRAWEK